MRAPTIQRDDMKTVVLHLTDLGFSVGLIAYMLNKTEVNIYAHLKSVNRMANRRVIRKSPGYNGDRIGRHVVACVRKVFPDSPWVLKHLVAMGQASAVTPRGFAIPRGSRKSAGSRA